MDTIASRIASVRDRIARAAQAAGRTPEEITLVAVTKTVDPPRIAEALHAGTVDLGENRVQELATKAPLLPGATWHLIGHLQSNKIRTAVSIARWIHTVDSVKLLTAIDRACAQANTPIDTLIEVNVSHEPQKYGVAPDACEALVAAAASCTHIRLRGLMTVAEFTGDTRTLHAQFAALRTLRDRLAPYNGGPVALTHLSMGMSHDFEIAIAEGATIVRVGSAIFGERPHAPLPA